MESFTSRNLVLLALGQIGVLVAVILGAAVAHKWYGNFWTIGPPTFSEMLLSYGWLALLLPVAWIIVTVQVFGNRNSSDEARIGVVTAGLLLFVLFLGVAWLGAVWPLLRLTHAFGI